MGHARARGGRVKAFLRQEAANLLTTLAVVVILGGVALNQHLTSATEGGMSYPSGGDMHYDGGSYTPPSGGYDYPSGGTDYPSGSYDSGGTYDPTKYDGTQDPTKYDGTYDPTKYEYDGKYPAPTYDQFHGDYQFNPEDYEKYKNYKDGDGSYQWPEGEEGKYPEWEGGDGDHKWEDWGYGDWEDESDGFDKGGGGEEGEDHPAPPGGGECIPGASRDDGCGGGCSCEDFDGQGFWLCTMQVCDGGVGAAGGGGDGGGTGGIPVACIDVKEMALGMLDGAQGQAPSVIAGVREENEGVANGMEQLRQKTIAEVNAISSDSCSVAAQKLNDLNEQVNLELSALWSQLGGKGDFGPEHSPVISTFKDQYGDFYQGYANEFERFFSEDEFAGIMGENRYTALDLSAIRQVDQGDVGQYLKYSTEYSPAGMDLFKYATDTHTISTDDLQELITLRNSLITEIEGMKAEFAKAWQEEMASTVAQYHFGPETAELAEEFVTEELPTLSSEAAAQKEFEKLLAASTKEKLENDWIAFADVDPDTLSEDQQWYVGPVTEAKALGIIEGTGESDGTLAKPGDPVNYAEIAKIVAETIPDVEIDPFASPTSDFGQECPDWAKPYVAALEDAGIKVDRIVGDVGPSDPATRANVFELFAAAHDDLGTADIDAVSHYEDSGDANRSEWKAAAKLVGAGIVGGYGGTNTLGFDDPINRAAAAKIAVKVIKKETQGGEHAVAPEEEAEEAEEEAPAEAPASEEAVSDTEVHDLLEDLGDLKQEVLEAREEQPRDAEVVDLQQDVHNLEEAIEGVLGSGEPVITEKQLEMWTDSLLEYEQHLEEFETGTFEGTSTGTYEKPTRRSLLEDLQSLLWPF